MTYRLNFNALNSFILKYIFLLLLIFFCDAVWGQMLDEGQKIKRCGTTQYYKALNQKIDIKKRLDIERQKLFLDLNRYQNNKQNGVLQRTYDNIDTLTLVFHVMLPPELQVYVTENVIKKQIDIANKDFMRLNIDSIKTPMEFKNLASGSHIQFALAAITPDLMPTNGINRINHTKIYNSLNVDNVKLKAAGGFSPWDASKYINIWVTQLDGISGISVFPYDTDMTTRGLVINYKALGDNTVSDILFSAYNKGRTLTHELGHFFNLRHIWADEDYCDDDDGFEDTPKQKMENNGGLVYPNISQLCTPSVFMSTMFMNYMDYSNDTCMNMFSKQQTKMMDDVLYTSSILTTLKESKAYLFPLIHDYDVSLIKVMNVDTISCTPFYPKVVFMNKGRVSLNSLSVLLYMDNDLLMEYKWRGNLAPRTISDTILLKYNIPELIYGNMKIVLANPNQETDEDLSNNDKTFPFIRCDATNNTLMKCMISFSPSLKQILVKLTGDGEQLKKIIVYNQIGQLLKEISVDEIGKKLMSFSVGELAPSLYIIKIFTDKNTYTQMLSVF